MNDFRNGMNIPKRNTMKLNQPSLVFWEGLSFFKPKTGAILFLGTCDTVARLAVLRHSDTMTAAALDAGLTPLATLMAHVTCGGAYTNRALPTEVRVGERRKELRVVKVFGCLFDKKKDIFGAIVGIPYGTIRALLVKLCWRMSVSSF